MVKDVSSKQRNQKKKWVEEVVKRYNGMSRKAVNALDYSIKDAASGPAKDIEIMKTNDIIHYYVDEARLVLRLEQMMST